MWKDILFCIMIIISIIIIDYFIQKYIKDSTEEMEENLNSLKQTVFSEKDDISKTKIEDIKKTWQKRYKMLASVIEHDELEKVEKNLTGIYSAFDSEERTEAIAEIDESIFILGHIKEKYRFKLENVF